MARITISAVNPIRQAQLTRFRSILRDGPVLVTTHPNPDPDALASGKAVAHLIQSKWGIKARLVYTGLVGRAENRAVLHWLTPEWDHFDTIAEPEKYSAVVFVDCQPGSGDLVPLDENMPVIVIDHHYPIREHTRGAAYADIRPNIGSTVTMIYQYLDAAQASIDPVLATAMFFGLRTDTNGLSRGSTIEDGIVYVKLLEMLDRQLLFRIEAAGLKLEYYQAFFKGMRNARVHGKAVIAYLGNMHRPDIAAELADLLFRYEGVHAAFCSGVYKGTLHFSIRTGLLDQDAGLLVQWVVFPPGNAGGHGTMAGGQMPLNGEDASILVQKLERRFLDSIGEEHAPKPLLKHPE